ncbi:hypothetical protein V6N13_013541 [Hibiscus sabdariffa]
MNTERRFQACFPARVEKNYLANSDRKGIVTLFVNNLPPFLHWSGLKQVFGRQGDVVDSFIANKLDRLGRRFGFVRFSNNRDADRAIERLNGFNLYGARIEVSYAKFQGRTSYWRKVKPRTETFVVNESKGKEKMHITSLSTGNRMDNCWNGKHKLFSSEPGESNKDCISHIKRIHGHVEEESLWRLSKSLIGLMATDCSTENVMDRLHNWGLGDLEIRSLGSRRFLIVIKDDDLLKTLEGQQWSLLKEVEYWVESFKIPERSTWIEVAGIPLHCWNSITFKRIAAAWGTLEALGENGRDLGSNSLREDVVSGSKNIKDSWTKAVDDKVNEDLSVDFDGSINESLMDIQSERESGGCFCLGQYQDMIFLPEKLKKCTKWFLLKRFQEGNGMLEGLKGGCNAGSGCVLHCPAAASPSGNDGANEALDSSDIALTAAIGAAEGSSPTTN